MKLEKRLFKIKAKHISIKNEKRRLDDLKLSR